MADILIIDDEKAIRKTLTEILSFEGYKIDEAADGEEGLKKFKEKTFDLVLCDIKMPKLDGIEFLDRSKEINPDVPVIMITAVDDNASTVKCIQRGAEDYLVKGRLDNDLLPRAIQYAVRSNLTVLSLVGAREGMPDPAPRRSAAAALLGRLERAAGASR